jgi:hypothetical protein
MAKNKAIQAHVVPIPLALVVCDHVHRDPGTKKHTILGTFAHAKGTTVPVLVRSMGIYFAVTDGRGTLPMEVRLIDVGGVRPPIFSIGGALTFEHPNAVAECGMNVPDVVFPEPDDYRLQLIIADKVITERKIIVDSHPEQEEK